MQLTERFKLSKIESGDPFLPGGLNSGTDQVEEALRIAHMGAVEEHKAQAALDARVTALEIHKIVVGAYQGNVQSLRFFDVGFTPKAVIIQSQNGGSVGFAVSPNELVKDDTRELRIVEGGFEVGTANHYSSSFNSNFVYRFVAFA